LLYFLERLGVKASCRSNSKIICACAGCKYGFQRALSNRSHAGKMQVNLDYCQDNVGAGVCPLAKLSHSRILSTAA